MDLVEEHRERHGLNRCLEAVGLAKSTWYYRQRRPDPRERDCDLRKELLEIDGGIRVLGVQDECSKAL